MRAVMGRSISASARLATPLPYLSIQDVLSGCLVENALFEDAIGRLWHPDVR
jgi:hypothetical protein